MSHATYLRYELVRTFRNKRFLFLSLGFPVVLFFMIATPNRHEHDLGGTGVSAPVYFMVGMAAFGTMNAVLAGGGRIAAERTAGWNRQLRLTPLSTRAYFRVKVLTAYVMAAVTIALLYISGAALGVHLAAAAWVKMTVQLLVGLVPFAAIGILLGLLLTTDSIGPAIGGSTALLSILGGVWFPVKSGAMLDLAKVLPSYWLVQAAHIGLGGSGWSGTGWAVFAAWTGVAAALAMRAYRRDAERATT